MSNNTTFKDTDFAKIRDYITKNYPPIEADLEEDELLQKLDELEEKGVMINADTKMSVMTSLPATQRVLVTINEMAKIIGMGHNSIRRLVRENPRAEYIHWVGTRAYLKREMFISVILEQSTI